MALMFDLYFLTIQLKLEVAQTSSTLSRDLIIGRIDTTTLYHVTAMLWYHDCETSLDAKQDAVIFGM